MKIWKSKKNVILLVFRLVDKKKIIKDEGIKIKLVIFDLCLDYSIIMEQWIKPI
jgi:hypothetical protein